MSWAPAGRTMQGRDSEAGQQPRGANYTLHTRPPWQSRLAVPPAPGEVDADDVGVLPWGSGPKEDGGVVVGVLAVLPPRALVLHKVVADGRKPLLVRHDLLARQGRRVSAGKGAVEQAGGRCHRSSNPGSGVAVLVRVEWNWTGREPQQGSGNSPTSPSTAASAGYTGHG